MTEETGFLRWSTSFLGLLAVAEGFRDGIVCHYSASEYFRPNMILYIRGLQKNPYLDNEKVHFYRPWWN